MARRRSPFTHDLRDEADIPNNRLELAIVITAQAMDCPDIWNAHVSAGRQAGLRDALVDVLHDHQPLPTLSDAEAALIQYGREWFAHHRVSETTFQAAQAQLGTQQWGELTTLMGHYAQTAWILNACEADLPEPLHDPVRPL